MSQHTDPSYRHCIHDTGCARHSNRASDKLGGYDTLHATRHLACSTHAQPGTNISACIGHGSSLSCPHMSLPLRKHRERECQERFKLGVGAGCSGRFRGFDGSGSGRRWSGLWRRALPGAAQGSVRERGLRRATAEQKRQQGRGLAGFNASEKSRMGLCSRMMRTSSRPST